MTIASEVSRLQTAKSKIKTSIENKWVSVPSNAKLDSYNTYIDSIPSWTSWLELFVPSTLILEDAISNRDNNVITKEDIFDVIAPDWSKYYHYFWYDNSESSSDTYYIWCATKVAWTNLWLVSSWAIPEWNYYYYSLTRNEWIRMKKVWNDIKLSVLYTISHDSNWWASSWWTLTCNYKCCNITNDTTFDIVDLWTITAENRSYKQEDIAQMYENRTTSSWMTASDVIPSIWLTSLYFRTWSRSYLYSLYANVNT